MNKVTIIDYGMGNLLSVQRALEKVGANVLISDDPNHIKNAACLVLPGVGAFADGMQALNERGLSEAIHQARSHDTPLLGICLGAQMLLDSSEEFGEHAGLGLIPGKVCAIPNQGRHSEKLKVPHMGWADLTPPSGHRFENPLLARTAANSAVYFVHSYQAHPSNTENIAAVCDYAGNSLTAMVSQGNVFGCQFHPEKSGPAGLAILECFLEAAA